MIRISSPSGSGSVEEAVNKCRLQRITLLREIAIKTGIQVYQFVITAIFWQSLCISLTLIANSSPSLLQILLREYHFDSEHKTLFTEEDILNIFPIVKHISPRSSDALFLLHCVQSRVQQGEHSE